MLCTLIGYMSNSYSQTKKEQIESLKVKYDSLNTVKSEERIWLTRKIDSLNLFIGNIKREKDSLFLKNEQLNMQNQLCIGQTNILQNQIKTINDSLSKYSTFRILSFSKSEEIEIIAGPILQVDYAVLQVSEKSIKGFVGWASQGSSEYFISGNLLNGTYIGDVFCVGSVQNCDYLKTGKFQLKIENMKLKLSGDARVDHDEIPAYNGIHFFNGGALTDLLDQPKMGSKVLLTNISNNDEMGAQIIEIGSFEKINDEYNLWYKVKINDVVGWIFGGLCTVCLIP